MRLTGAKCQCTVCGLGFGSERAFNRHRVGEVGQPDRRCMTVAEMTTAAWAEDDRGFWLVPDARRAGADLEAPSAPPPATHVAGQHWKAANGRFVAAAP